MGRNFEPFQNKENHSIWCHCIFQDTLRVWLYFWTIIVIYLSIKPILKINPLCMIISITYAYCSILLGLYILSFVWKRTQQTIVSNKYILLTYHTYMVHIHNIPIQYSSTLLKAFTSQYFQCITIRLQYTLLILKYNVCGRISNYSVQHGMWWNFIFSKFLLWVIKFRTD